MKALIFLVPAIVLLFSCGKGADAEAAQSEERSPVVGNWLLAVAGDSTVVDNPFKIAFTFRPNGTVYSRQGTVFATGTYVISDDNSLITIMEAGKVVADMKVLTLTEFEMIIQDGDDLLTFVPIPWTIMF